MSSPSPPLAKVYRALHAAWGPQDWWPAESALEMMVGAVLTQNTAWTHVEKAIDRLKADGALDLHTLHDVPLETLADWIRPSGYFNVKARRLRALTTMVVENYGGDVAALLAESTDRLRGVLLEVNGIGPETADSIVLYAAEHPVFVVDAYTRRFMERHGWLRGGESYDEVATVFTDALPKDVELYNEFHALIVNLGKDYCRPRPDCSSCPLCCFLPPGGRIEQRQ